MPSSYENLIIKIPYTFTFLLLPNFYRLNILLLKMNIYSNKYVHIINIVVKRFIKFYIGYKYCYFASLLLQGMKIKKVDF